MSEFFYTRVRSHSFSTRIDQVRRTAVVAHRDVHRCKVVTLVESELRARIDSISQTSFDTIHTTNEQQAAREIYNLTVGVLLFSPKTGFVRERSAMLDSAYASPGIWILPVISGTDAVSYCSAGLPGILPSGPLNLSTSRAVDVLRSLTSPMHEGLTADLLVALTQIWRDVPVEVRRFFIYLFRVAPKVTSVRALCRLLGVAQTTFNGPFFRVGVPSVKTYLAMFRLLHVAAILEDESISVANVSVTMNYSSPQHLCRHVNIALGMTARTFRTLGFHQLLTHIVHRLFVPFRAELGGALPRDVAKLIRSV